MKINKPKKLQKISLITGTLVVLFSVGLATHNPKVLYSVRLIQAKIARQGWVSGEGIVRLNVPFHRQEHSLSCEVASLKMALAGVGIDVPESELVANIEYDNTPRSNEVWGDPYKGFVGSINGRMMKDGYGVYWEPIARLGLRYTRTEVVRDGTLASLTNHLDSGRPLVVWGHFGSGSRIEWKTPEGRIISGVNGEHARTLIGYIGVSSNPHTLIMLDPIYGEMRFSASDFLKNWQALENGAVAVYPTARWVKAFGNPTIWEISADGKTKYGLAMAWDEFVNQGGFAEAVKEVTPGYLNVIENGGILKTLFD